jgi:uncharacterized protein (DUF433 family)
VVDWTERIAIDPKICRGRACIKGTRVTVAVLLANLAEGLTAEEIVAEYPSISVADVHAAMAYAAELAAEEDLIPMSVRSTSEDQARRESE